MRNRIRGWLTWLVTASLLAGCAGTRLASTWRDPQDRSDPLRKLAVFVIAKDENLRRFAEDQAVRSLPRGTQGVASYTLFDRAAPDEARVRERLGRDGFDAVIVARTVSVDRSTTYVPPQTHIVPIAPVPVLPHYRSFYGYYTWAYESYTTPGYTAETTRVIIETLVYRLPEGKPVWSGVTETVNPDSALDLVTELVRIVREELQKTGLLPGAAGGATSAR